MDLNFTFTAELWLYPAQAAWVFVTVPKDNADEIKFFTGPSRRGFGSVRVDVQIGETKWKTSLFPDSKSGSCLLPVKAAVRKVEELEVGDEVTVSLRALV